MSYLSNAEKLKAEIDENRKVVNQVNTVGGIREETIQSDKIGYDWHAYYVNDILVRRDYVEQETPYGTADNPIVWKEGMSLIPNAYYIYNDIRKVWMGEEGVIASWDDTNFVEF